MARSVAAGRILELASTATLSEATAGGVEAGAVTFPLCAGLVDTWSVVGEEDIKVNITQMGVATLWREEGERVEGAAGMCVAAVRAMADTVRGARVAVVLCGGNIDQEAHADILRG